MGSLPLSSAPSRRTMEELKFACLTDGIALAPRALDALGGADGITVHEYPTTGGLTFALSGVYVNAPFDEPGNELSDVSFDVAADAPGFEVGFRGQHFSVDTVLPLPGYIGSVLSNGQRVDDLVMTHVDRVRVSPLKGCVYDCGFCNLAELRYERRPAELLVEALQVASSDQALPVRHALISGGSPGPAHVDWFIETCTELVRSTPMPVDVMFSARDRGPEVVDALVDAGVQDLSINLELFDPAASRKYLGAKHEDGRPHFERTVGRAVERLAGRGRVRSLLLPGLEPEEQTLAGVEYLAGLGVDPVISPFRPAPDIALRHVPVMSAEALTRVVDGARTIAAGHGVELGPRCQACQHNTATLPWDSHGA